MNNLVDIPRQIAHKFIRIEKRNLSHILTGNLSPKELRRFLFSIDLIFSILLIIARLTFPPWRNYQMTTHMISYLGDYIKNPKGWWALTMALMILGLALQPLAFYLYKRLKFISERTARFFRYCLKGAGVSLVIVGFFPDVSEQTFYYALLKAKDVHVIFALIFFVFVFSCLFSLVLLLHQDLRENHPHHILPKKISIWGAFLSFFIFIGLYVTQTIAIKSNLTFPFPGFYSLSFWEWFAFLHFLFTINIISVHISYHFPGADQYTRIVRRKKQKQSKK